MRKSVAILLSAMISLMALALAPSARAQDEGYGPELQGFDYPYPVSTFAFTSQGEALEHGLY
jgi:hypothetical protein